MLMFDYEWIGKRKGGNQRRFGEFAHCCSYHIVTLPIMMPAYRSMDSYPYQRNQIPFPLCYHPGTEPIPPQMNMDPSKSPFPYEQHWPYAANYGHPIPPHFCCGHNNFPFYYNYRPSHPHAPTPMYHYSGGCPAYGESFSVPYSPQPHYTMELPKYEYDKHMPREHHCCGCPNHSCNQKEGKSVKIEKHEPDGGKKVNDDALIPIQFKSYPYPFVWIPPEYTSNRKMKNPNTAEVGEQDKISHGKRPSGPESFLTEAQPAHEPRVWNGWLPFDGAPNMVLGGDGMRNQNLAAENNRGESKDGRVDQKPQSENTRSEFPFPIFWLPYYNKQEESGKTNNKENTSSPKIVEEVPHTFKFVPVKSHIDEGDTNGTRSNQAGSTDNTHASDVTEKLTNARSIPVKQIELHQGKNDSEGRHTRDENVSHNQMKENMTETDSGACNKKRQSTSPPNSSKLPPVCLRVDPLPKKKSGNGSSRSPSPPSSKGHSQPTASETFKAHGMKDESQQNLKFQNASDSSEKSKPKENQKTIQVAEYKTNETKGVDIPIEGPKVTRETRTDEAKYTTEDKKAEKVVENVIAESDEQWEAKDSSTPIDEGRKEGRVLSDADAAVLIQAVYRGYQVRKWEPLKKLKQIDEIRKEVAGVQGRVEAFESSADLQIDDKQKIAIAETIMRLLLKLDTIQGLHPSFREIRKSLARELTTLQERLDSIMAKKPQQQQMHDFDVQKPVDVTPMNAHNEGHVQEQQEEKVAATGEYQSPNGIVNEDDNSQVVTADDALNSTSDLPETDKIPVEPEVKSEESTILVEVEHKLDIGGVVDEDIHDVSTEKDVHDVNCETHDVLDLENNAFRELPVGLLDRNEKDDGTNNPKGDIQAENEVFIEELPVGLLDEDTTKSVVEKHDEEDQTAEEGERNTDEKRGPSTDNDTTRETPLEQEEVQSSEGSDCWVKVEFDKDDELKEHSPMGIEAVCQPEKVVGNETKLQPLTTQVNDHENGGACLESNNVNNILPEPMDLVPHINKEGKPDLVVEKDMETLDQVKTGVSAASQQELDHDEGLNGDLKLLKENEKLREMMKKLLEAGNQQLSVISDLSGRVKDLEKKLAKSRKSKKVKTKRNRAATSKK
ncbi:hypothetical protein RJT34_15602 [Clitoria ternatea]|uniref:BAG domain-containing protein n=1 Tax=Clitoria ternatea TaxID=43366 RepID=A0AAN9J8P0_CLITE